MSWHGGGNTGGTTISNSAAAKDNQIPDFTPRRLARAVLRNNHQAAFAMKYAIDRSNDNCQRHKRPDRQTRRRRARARTLWCTDDQCSFEYSIYAHAISVLWRVVRYGRAGCPFATGDVVVLAKVRKII